MKIIKNIYRDKDNKIVINNIILSLIIKGLALIVGFYSMNAYLTYFKDANYLGVWLAIVSVINWILTFDLGIGNGLRNHVTKLLAENREEEVKIYISSAYYSLGVISLIGLIFFIVLAYTLNWNSLLNISQEIISSNILCNILAISFLNIFIRFFLNLITSILYALQKTFVINLISLLTNCCLLIYLFVIKPTSDLTGIYQLSYVHLLISNIPLLLASIIIFSSSLKSSRPNIKNVDNTAVKSVLSLGGLFFIAQIQMLLMNATNEFLIINNYGARSVVDYQIYFKVFSIASMVFVIIIQPIWSAITQCVGTKNYKKITNYSSIMYVTAILGTIACIVVAFFFQEIVSMWLNENAIKVSIENAIIFAIYIGSFMLMNSSTCVANGFGKIKTQIIYLTFALIIKYSFTFFFCENWIDMILVTAILQIGLTIVQEIANRNTIRRLNRMEKNYNEN